MAVTMSMALTEPLVTIGEALTALKDRNVTIYTAGHSFMGKVHQCDGNTLILAFDYGRHVAIIRVNDIQAIDHKADLTDA